MPCDYGCKVSFSVSANEFIRLSLTQKLKTVKNEGNYLAQRNYQSYSIYLYAINDFLVEVWKKLGYNQIHWIELIDRDRVNEVYSEHIKLNLD